MCLRRRPTTSRASTRRCRRCWPTRASIISTRRPAARAARRARGCRRGSACCGARKVKVSTTYSPPRVASPRLAANAAELAGHFAVRRTMFVERQRLFEDDRDERDGDALHAVAVVDGAVVGAVRLYPLSGTLWKGDRLAVLPGHHAGADLVNFAVQTAAERGGSRMVAQVQVANVRFFERLGWGEGGGPPGYPGGMPPAVGVGGCLRNGG